MPSFLQNSLTLADANNVAAGVDQDIFMFGAKSNPNYIARVFQVQGGGSGAAGALIAKGYLPESFNLSMSADWNEPFASIGAGTLGDAIQLMTNRKLVSQAMTIQVWQGTAPVRFNLRFHFVAYNDALADVVQPTISLFRLTAPSRGAGGVLIPPGPDVQWLTGIGANLESITANGLQSALNTIRGSGTSSAGGTPNAPSTVNTAKGKISIFVGKFLHFDNVVVENVDVEYDTMFTKDGLPISAKADVTFKTFTILVQAQPGSDTNNAQDDDISVLFNQTAGGANANF